MCGHLSSVSFFYPSPLVALHEGSHLPTASHLRLWERLWHSALWACPSPTHLLASQSGWNHTEIYRPTIFGFSFFFSYTLSATSKLRFPSIVAPLLSYRPYYLHLRNAAVSCHCSLFVLWHCHVKCFSFRTQRNTWRGFLSASKERQALNKLQLQVSLAFICQSILHWKHCLHYQLWNLWEHENFLAQESKLLQNGLSMW